jgi:IclR family transcriptional regulator, mhp operon transcriptional activator
LKAASIINGHSGKNCFQNVPLSGTLGNMSTVLQHKSLDRGITVMETLAREGACSLADLHRISGISKSSIRRILATLVTRRLVRQSFADKKYRINVVFPVAASEPVPADQAYAVDVALPIVSELTKKIEWPSDIHLLEGDRMRVLDSTRPLSPFHLYRGVVNRQLNIFGAATGMCCLAELGATEFHRIVAHLVGDGVWGLERIKMQKEEYLNHIRETRERGYGVRVAGLVGPSYFGDGLSAIACPIYSGTRLVGAVSLLWPKAYLSNEEFGDRYASDLIAATNEISEKLSDFSKRRSDR